MFSYNLATVVDGLFLDIEQNTHIAVRGADDGQDGKLHIRLRQCRIVFAQAADSTVQSAIHRGNQLVDTLFAQRQLLVAIGLQPFRELRLVTA